MTSLSKIGSLAYYLHLSQEDYWSRENPVGIWEGKGAQALGLTGGVTSEQLEQLFAGVSPDGSAALVMNAGSSNRCIGWDMTLSAPKSFSTLWSQAEAAERRALERVHGRAVADTLAHLDENIALVRTGKGGECFERAGVVVAVFQHGSSRNHDPQMHSHCLLLNIGVTDRHSTHALFSPTIFDRTHELGAVYRACLAFHLEQEFGLKIERNNDLIEVKGVPRDLIKVFSSRRHTIEQELEAKGWTSAKAAGMVTLTTRPPKTHVSQEVLLDRWQKVGQRFGFSTQEVTHLLHNGQRRVHSPEQEREEIMAVVKERLAERETFTDAEIIRAIALEAPGRGMDRTEIEMLWREFAHSEAVTRLSQSYTARYVLTERPEPSHRMEYALRSLSLHTPEQEPEWEHR